jgi:hypothetical protein
VCWKGLITNLLYTVDDWWGNDGDGLLNQWKKEEWTEWLIATISHSTARGKNQLRTNPSSEEASLETSRKGSTWKRWGKGRRANKEFQTESKEGTRKGTGDTRMKFRKGLAKEESSKARLGNTGTIGTSGKRTTIKNITENSEEVRRRRWKR